MSKSIRAQGDDLGVVEVNDLTGVGDDGADVAGQEMLALADAEDERAAAAGADDDAGEIFVNDGDAVGADDLAQGFTDGLNEGGLGFLRFLVECRADQMREHLGVGLRVENVCPFS